jgi:hypothetical protein
MLQAPETIRLKAATGPRGGPGGISHSRSVVSSPLHTGPGGITPSPLFAFLGGFLAPPDPISDCPDPISDVH